MTELAELTLSDIRVGLSEEISKNVLQEDIDSFAALTGDKHPLHTDKDYAKASGYKDVIAHGLLLSSYTSRLIGMKLPGRNALVVSEEFEYKKPSFPGDELKILGTVSEVDERFSLLTIKVSVLNQNNEKVAKGYYKVMMRRAGKAGAAG